MKTFADFPRRLSLCAAAISVSIGCTAGFSPISPRGHRSFDVKPSSTSSLYVQHVFVHDEGLSREDKDELMPCEVQRHGRRNEKLFREDAVNPDGPDIISPHRGAPRPPTKPASAYVNVHEEVDSTMPGPPAHMFARNNNNNHRKIENFVDATVVSDSAPPPPPVYQEAPQPAPVPSARASPGPPPVGMFNRDTVDTSLLNLDFGESSAPRSAPGPPPVGTSWANETYLDGFVQSKSKPC